MAARRPSRALGPGAESRRALPPLVLDSGKSRSHLNSMRTPHGSAGRPARRKGAKSRSRICRFNKEDIDMRQFDLSPLYRSTVGFDRLFSLIDSMANVDAGAQTYPPYNIERTGENAYRITMAVAGFGEADLDIEAKQNVLTVRGDRKDEPREEGREVLYRGIAGRAFERRFQLADHVQVTGAALENGLLHIDLVREIPEAMKARKIAIGESGPRQIDAKAQPRSAA
jgi:molecular chaperone IbpA